MGKSAFKDNFSATASHYAKFRPTYPPELFQFVSSLPTERLCAWDSGTGNGQAAVGLATHFDQVVATDPSEKQLQFATPHPKITYIVSPAEQTNIPSDSVDLITAATAAHWFHLDKFYKEVRRVARRGAWIALWTYNSPSVSFRPVHELLKEFEEETIGSFWDTEIALVADGYRSLPFPFPETKAPAFEYHRDLSLENLMGYLSSWSATHKYAAAMGKSPLPELQSKLAAEWGNPDQTHTMNWGVSMRVGQVTR